MEGMSPEMMKMAMEQMKNMTPAQMEALMASMPAGGFSPEVMRAAQAQASKMSASDWQAAQQKLGGLSPEELRKQAAAANSQLAARQAYVISACRTLKDEGNKLHGQGKWAEAAAKYERAHGNLSPPAAGERADSNDTPSDPAAAAAAASDEGRELRRACALNLASCCLQQGEHARAQGLCDEVLLEDAGNVKALYRRGQARQGLGELRGAERDLSEAVRRTEAAGGGEAQLAPIRARLAGVKAAREAAGDEGQEDEEEVAAAGKGGTAAAAAAAAGAAAAAAGAGAKAPASAPPKARTVSGSCVVEEAPSDDDDDDDDEEGRVEEAAPPPAAKAEKKKAASAPAVAPQPPAAMCEALEAMRRDPEAVKRAAQAMRDMSPEELAAACAAAGAANGGAPGGVSPEQARMAAEMMRSMKPEDVARMAEQAAAMAGAGAGAAAGAGAGMPAPGGAPPMPDEAQMRALADGLGNMSDAELEQLAAAAGGAGFGGAGPGGAQVTPSMMRMAAQMMRTMKPEDMAAMQRMAAAAGGGVVGGAGVGAGGATGGSGGASSSLAAASTPGGGLPPDLAKRMMEPAMVEQMLGMLQSMDERSLAEMLKGAMPGGGGGAAGGASDEAALKLARQLKKVTPRQARALATMASGVQRAVDAARRAREALAGRGMLMVALAVLVVAVVLRLLGWGA